MASRRGETRRLEEPWRFRDGPAPWPTGTSRRRSPSRPSSRPTPSMSSVACTATPPPSRPCWSGTGPRAQRPGHSRLQRRRPLAGRRPRRLPGDQRNGPGPPCHQGQRRGRTRRYGGHRLRLRLPRLHQRRRRRALQPDHDPAARHRGPVPRAGRPPGRAAPLPHRQRRWPTDRDPPRRPRVPGRLAAGPRGDGTCPASPGPPLVSSPACRPTHNHPPTASMAPRWTAYAVTPCRWRSTSPGGEPALRRNGQKAVPPTTTTSSASRAAPSCGSTKPSAARSRRPPARELPLERECVRPAPAVAQAESARSFPN